MYRSFLAAALTAAGLLSAGQFAKAEDAVQPVYIVTYVEVAPSSTAEARKLMSNYVKDARKASGAVEIEALQRISDPAHFALVEQWQSQAAKQAYAATSSVTSFRAALVPLQSSAYDERIHNALSVGPPKPVTGDPIFVVTHVDVIPTQVDSGTARVKAFAEQGRAAPGNRRFDDVVQANRKNHFTLIESWDRPATKSAWISSRTARDFRQELQPMSGALYDERIYRLVR